MICAIMVNIAGLNFEKIKNYKEKINPLGKLITSLAGGIKVSQTMNHIMAFYSVYSGTNKGDEFYSPNVPSSIIDFSYIANGKPINIPLFSSEAKIKFVTATLYLESYFRKTALRNQILKSISLRIFSIDSTIQKLDINISINEVKPLASYQDQKQIINRLFIPGFVITRRH